MYSAYWPTIKPIQVYFLPQSNLCQILEPHRKHPIQHLAFSRPIPDTRFYGSHCITTTCSHASWWNLEPVSLVSGRLYFIWWNKLNTSVTPEPVTGPRRTSGGLEPGLKWNEQRAVRGVRLPRPDAWCQYSSDCHSLRRHQSTCQWTDNQGESVWR